VNVLHHDLETIEELGLRVLHLSHKILCEIFVDNAIGSGKECKDVLDEVTLVVIELFAPVHQVCRKINLLSGPKAGL